MKYFRHFLVLVAALALSAVSCQQAPFLTMNGPKSFTFSKDGGSQSFTFSTNKEWSVRSSESWCKVSPASGSAVDGNVTVTITVDKNTSYDSRNCTLTVKVEDLMETVSVSQDMGLGLIVSPTTLNLTNVAQDIEIEVQKNVVYTVTISDTGKSFITYNGTKGLSSEKASFSIAANETYDNREGVIIFQQTGGDLKQTVTIKQSQTNGLFITTPEYNLSNEAHTLTVEVKANVEFEVTSQADWIKYVSTSTKALKPSQITLEVAANETYDDREGQVIVKQKGGDMVGTITIRQDENYGILVSSDTIELSNEAQSTEIEVLYNVDFDVIIPDDCSDWLSLVSTKSLTSKTYTFAIAKNDSYDDRSGSITFKQRDGSLAETVTVKQKQTDAIIIDHVDYTISAAEQILKITVKSNVDYQVKVGDECGSWLSFIQTKGLQENVLSFKVERNDGEEREGIIYINDTIIKVKQNAIEFVQFEDPVFKEYCVENYDVNNDGEISTIEADNIYSIAVYTDNIYSLVGIEKFAHLKTLSCVPYGSGYSISSTGSGCVRNNGEDVWGNLSELNVSNNNELVSLQCYGNYITELRLNNNTKLKEIDCSFNPLNVLEIDKCKDLQTFIARAVSLSFSDFSTFKELTELDCSANLLETINVRENKYLRTLKFNFNNIDEIDVSNNPELLSFECDANKILTLDVTKNEKLTHLSFSRNSIASIDLTNNKALIFLSCSNTSISRLDVTHNTRLMNLYAYHCKLTSFDITNNPNIEYLYVNDNYLTSLDVSMNGKLRYFLCQNNLLESLDVSNNVLLKTLTCDKNRISVLDVSNNTVLSSLSCVDNPYLKEIWLRNGQVINDFKYDSTVKIMYTDTVPVKSISLDKTTVELGEGMSVTLTATVLPDDATNKTVTWSSSDASIASVENGRVTGIKQGEAVITAKAGGKSATCAVTVKHELSDAIIFADANFKAYCVHSFDTNGDGEITTAEALDVTTIDCCTDNITSLEGIEYFSNLQSLSAKGSGGRYSGKNGGANSIGNYSLLPTPEPGTSVATGQLTGVNLIHLNKLTQIDLSCNNTITNFNPSDCPSLRTIRATFCNISEINIRRNAALISLDCYSNQLSSLDVSNNNTLTYLLCNHNQLSSLDVSNNTALTLFDCGDNQLSTIDVSNNTALVQLFCSRNQLSTLDLRNNTALRDLYCDENQLSTLDLRNNTALTRLHCRFNQLFTLDVSNNNALTDLSCSSNQLTTLDASNNTAIQSLECGSNQLSTLNVGNNSSITTLVCMGNQLTSLDVSNNTALALLSCSRNQLTTLDVSNNTALTNLLCMENQLTTLDVSNNTALEKLYCISNPYLTEIWLKTGQTIQQFIYDMGVATIKYKD